MQSNRQEGKHDEQLRELVVEAERALARRELALATQLLAKAETITPEPPLILNARGMQKLHEGQLQAAKELAERAVARDATNPAFWINLATIQRALTAPEAEMQALERALALEPRHLLALLQKASLLELLERPRAAAKVYRAALQTIAPGTAVPPLLQKPLQRALAAVRANDAALEQHLAHKQKSTRLNSSHSQISYAVFCLKKKKKTKTNCVCTNMSRTSSQTPHWRD